MLYHARIFFFTTRESLVEMIAYHPMKIFMVFCFLSASNGDVSTCDKNCLTKNLEICNQKLAKERELHKNDKTRVTRLKLHLKNTRHNIRVYQRMVQVMVKISVTWTFYCLHSSYVKCLISYKSSHSPYYMGHIIWAIFKSFDQS